MTIAKNLRPFSRPLFCGLLAATVSAPALSANLSLTIKPVKQSKGNLMVAVYNSKDTFQKNQLTAQRTDAVGGEMEINFNDLPAGEYAVMVYHDVNGNEKLDTNLLGLPTEPWGGSLQGKRGFGAPGWNDTRLELSTSDLSMTIELN